MPWWLLAVLTAGLAVIGTEFINRTQPSLAWALTRTWPLIVIAQMCLYYAWNRGPSLMLVWACWALSTALIRLAMVGLVLHEPMRPWIVALGVATILIGSYVVKVGTS